MTQPAAPLGVSEKVKSLACLRESALVTMNEKPLAVAYKNTGTQKRALRKH
jgi:hypothetical protein